MTTMPVRTSKPPYYAVMFVAKLRDCDLTEYFERVEALTKRAWEFGFMGEDSVRLEDGRLIGIQYWPTLEHVAKWRQDFEHGIAIDGGSFGMSTTSCGLRRLRLRSRSIRMGCQRSQAVS